MLSPGQIDKLIDEVKDRIVLPEHKIIKLIIAIFINNAIIAEEPNIVSLSAPITVVGDLHDIFQIVGEPLDAHFLFLGDYVDRGRYSLETITLLSLYKLKFPSKITLLRGNHESRQITRVYGFYADCLSKYSNVNVWETFNKMFDFLPVAALVEGFLAIHGGLSPSFHAIDSIRAINRMQEIPPDGIMADLTWSDPDDTITGWKQSNRQVGYLFGKDIFDQFIWMNNIEGVLRAHQLCLNGYLLMFDNRLVTVWSAPNYCYRIRNNAAVLQLDNESGNIFQVFSACPETESRTHVSRLKLNSDFFM